LADLLCWNCGERLVDVPRPVSRLADCPRCRSELRCCRMCRYFNPRAGGEQCDEDRAEPPSNKEVGNVCEWFDPVEGRFDDARASRQDAARARLDALFGGGNAGDD
jgi:hypothetical protein